MENKKPKLKIAFKKATLIDIISLSSKEALIKVRNIIEFNNKNKRK